MLKISHMTAALTLALGMAFSTAQADEVTVKQGDTTLRGELTLADGKTAKDGVVLLLHGTFAHNKMEIMQALADLLKEKGYNTLAVNLSFSVDKRPSDMLDCKIEHKHKHEDAIAELDTWMNWLKEQGASKVVVLGHSRGGNQAAWYAAEKDSALLDKVVAVAPATADPDKASKEYEERYKKPLADILAEAQKLVDAGKGDTVMELPGLVYCENAKATANSVIGYYKTDERRNTPNLLSKIKKPMLIVMGSADEVVADLPAKLEGIKQENLKLETVEGADHFFLDLYADELADKVVGFVGW
ncbi:MAG TPA: alpha/beta hydrolase [Candidatus Thiothrix moscowensis]|uniref:alpha/beta hydrolase n=1 Tax=unclassified Thiothrix TaxID=2636184 RepID=UPI0025E898B1|nr:MULTISPECIES: alpha/beta hydrolase [unclassified Thiothrix]HRJ54178.1 alpha/beta hydrolase [Candidatus Thiothrix moscowensis]HRJ94330.1 alpha/beta hydrolase [Candidatus Thiothrix moscowensis]